LLVLLAALGTAAVRRLSNLVHDSDSPDGVQSRHVLISGLAGEGDVCTHGEHRPVRRPFLLTCLVGDVTLQVEPKALLELTNLSARGVNDVELVEKGESLGVDAASLVTLVVVGLRLATREDVNLLLLSANERAIHGVHAVRVTPDLERLTLDGGDFLVISLDGPGITHGESCLLHGDGLRAVQLGDDRLHLVRVLTELSSGELIGGASSSGEQQASGDSRSGEGLDGALDAEHSGCLLRLVGHLSCPVDTQRTPSVAGCKSHQELFPVGFLIATCVANGKGRATRSGPGSSHRSSTAPTRHRAGSYASNQG